MGTAECEWVGIPFTPVINASNVTDYPSRTNIFTVTLVDITA